MKVLLVGSGGREHALAWKLSRSKVVDQLLCWPANPAIRLLAEVPRLDGDPGWPGLVDYAVDHGVDFMVVGPEQPLADGLADLCADKGLPVFGPAREPAMLEASKHFAKEVMAAAGIPTAAYHLARSREECRAMAVKMLKEKGGTVLKASGLAGGKGVFVCTTEEQLNNGLHRLYDTSMSSAATEVVIEEILHGRECSFFSFVGKGGATPLGFAVDFKRLQDGDLGPNTGGMGCYTPVPWLPADAARQVDEAVVQPLLAEFSRRGLNYTGCLYTGLMWSEDKGPQVVEFNVRLGDPEAQVLAVQDPRDWGALIAAKLGLAEAVGEFDGQQDFQNGSSVAVVMASAGYPYGAPGEEHPVLDQTLFANESADGCVFGAAVQPGKDDAIVVGSGRVMVVASRQDNFHQARATVYQKVRDIAKNWQGVQYREDIASRVLDR